MMCSPWILGISASHNNGAACLLKGDEVVVAVQEERLTRHKRHGVQGARRSLAIQYCLQHANIEVEDLNLIVLSCQTHRDSPENKIFANPQLELGSREVPVISVSHHLAHAISAYVTSGYREASILVADGMGSPWNDLTQEEQIFCRSPKDSLWETVSLYAASNRSITPLFEDFVRNGAWLTISDHGMPQFGSLGGMFSAAAHQIFGHLMDAGKVMGLEAYGTNNIPNSEFYSFERDHFTFASEVCARFPHDERWPNRRTEYQNLAASVQNALESALLRLVRRLSVLSSCDCLCLSGGVALNSVAVERICRSARHRDIYVFPAAEDSGVAVGAAYYGLWQLGGSPAPRRIKNDCYGCNYSVAEMMNAIKTTPGITLISANDPTDYTAEALAKGRTVGWFQGGSELGPRALGQRSILFDPRRPDGKDYLNKAIKRRESFRPFAPACLAKEAEKWFDVRYGKDVEESPFMTRTVPVKPAAAGSISAVLHIDQSARIQTVTAEGNPAFHDLIRRFFDKTGIPMVLNTSFNIAGQPLVETPSDALWSMLALSLDVLVLGSLVVLKKPGINSLFDLYPICLNRPLNLVRPKDAPQNNSQGRDGSYFSANCETPWGEFERFFPAVTQDILERMDGIKSVGEIYNLLAGTVKSLSEIHMIHLMLELVQAKLIDLAETPRTT